VAVGEGTLMFEGAVLVDRLADLMRG